MKILLTGANGYVGKRLIPILLNEGHQVVALVRRNITFDPNIQSNKNLSILQADLLDPATLNNIPLDCEVAYYLVHSMGQSSEDFAKNELHCVGNFLNAIKKTNIRQIIYLSGISNDTKTLSTHLQSRLSVEEKIKESKIPYTILHAGIIIGSGSSSFEMIRDLCEKLPIMVAPKWVNNKTQPIAIRDVLFYLKAVLNYKSAENEDFEIGGPDQLTYKEMLLGYSKVRRLKRLIINVPVLTPRLSSYWLYFITSTNFTLAQALVDSLKNNTVVQNTKIQEAFPHQCINYESAVKFALDKIEENQVSSSWRDTLVFSRLDPGLQKYMKVPTEGCLIDKREIKTKTPVEQIIKNVWSVGGKNGWGYANWAWKLRGFFDKLFGGVGLNRGRTNVDTIQPGDVIDFWRVIVADRKSGRLVLYAEMKLPGEAWLEYKVTSNQEENTLIQTATFRPKGLLGRLYWYILLPIHHFIFIGMGEYLVRDKN